MFIGMFDMKKIKKKTHRLRMTGDYLHVSGQ